MKPILFSENSTTFSTNGIGRLADAISCVVTEERNGMYELEMEYPIDGQHYSDIGIRKIIAAIPCDGGTMQAFRIYQISKPISGRVIINAQHISYDLSKNTCMPFNVTSSPSACNSTLQRLKTNAVESCPFSFWTNVTTAGSYTQSVPATIKSRLGGVEGSVLDQFGGEFEWDNFTVKLHNQRGTLAVNNGITLRYGKNITDITQEENIAETATGVVPYWIDNEGTRVTLTEKAVYSPYTSRYSQHLTIPLDLSDKFEDKPSESALRTAAQVVANQMGLPRVSIEVSFVALWQTEEYKDVAPLQRVKLCDEITVKFEKLGVDVTAKIVRTEYDVLADRYRSIQIGSVRSNLAQTLNDQAAQTIQAIEAQSVATSQAINNATKWLTSAGGYVIAIKHTDGSWKELIFASSTDLTASNTKILRINNNGIGFSKTGINGTYTQAWTIDGNLVADFITTGTMSAARIKGGTLQLGGNNNANGILQILNASGTEIGRWDVNGINVKAGSINLGSGKFVVTLAGALTATDATITGAIKATSGEIGSGNSKFTITDNHIANGKSSLADTNDGVYIGTDGIALGSNSKFKVTKAGALNATNATIEGSITSKDGTTRTTAISGGKIIITTPSGGVYDQMEFRRGSEYVEMGARRAFWSDTEYSQQADWSDILNVAKNRDVIKAAVNQTVGGWDD